MNWDLALKFAREQLDITYEEWCALYVDRRGEVSLNRVKRALRIAHPILVRNKLIEESVEFTLDPVVVR